MQAMSPERTHPVVLIVAGNDPSGGAGIQADIQAVTAMGGHPAPVITALTVQDTVNAYEVSPVEAGLVVRQAEAVLDDLPVAAIKIGLLATPQIAEAVASLLSAIPDIPVVLDPVLYAAGGAHLAQQELLSVLRDSLFPRTRLATPNALEIRAFAGHLPDNDARAMEFVKWGCDFVLIKGADEDTDDVHNLLYDKKGEIEHCTWSRLPHTYHGSGCTLASAIAALLAKKHSVPAAVRQAQRYTYEALRNGYQPGSGQHVPHRFFHLPEHHH